MTRGQSDSPFLLCIELASTTICQLMLAHPLVEWNSNRDRQVMAELRHYAVRSRKVEATATLFAKVASNGGLCIGTSHMDNQTPEKHTLNGNNSNCGSPLQLILA